MAPKGKYLNTTQRKLVIDLVKQGNTYRKVEELTNIPFTTVGAIVKKYQQYETFEIHTGRGRKRKTSSRDDREILRMIKKKSVGNCKKYSKSFETLNRKHNLTYIN
jgi:transposase